MKNSKSPVRGGPKKQSTSKSKSTKTAAVAQTKQTKKPAQATPDFKKPKPASKPVPQKASPPKNVGTKATGV